MPTPDFTKDAQERAKEATGDPHYLRAWGLDHAIAEQIRQAEQAAREKALEDAAIACEDQQRVFGSNEYAVDQPFSSHGERFACGSCAEKIRALKDQK